jgi:hypothetical protein
MGIDTFGRVQHDWPIEYQERSSYGGHTTVCYQLYSAGEGEDLNTTME